MNKIEYKIYKNPEGYDSDNIRFLINGEERGFGYIGRNKDTIALMRCPKCGKENYAMSVSLGQCAWCGFNTSEAILTL